MSDKHAKKLGQLKASAKKRLPAPDDAKHGGKRTRDEEAKARQKAFDEFNWSRSVSRAAAELTARKCEDCSHTVRTHFRGWCFDCKHDCARYDVEVLQRMMMRSVEEAGRAYYGETDTERR